MKRERECNARDKNDGSREIRGIARVEKSKKEYGE